MVSLSVSQSRSEDAIWHSLKQAIAASSGFQRWLAERSLDYSTNDHLNMEQLVTCYLRETLATLAY
ncbi:MAG: hypothetical protein MUF72_07590 [Elainella sp. Prado103]|jgi:hypothetical protein|nr:hypothetical protein [Elainella sp. Prado103]